MGVEIVADATSPAHILHCRVVKAKIAFAKIRNNARLLGLSSCRVRLQLISALVTSVLLFAAPVYACLSDTSMRVNATGKAFREAEDAARGFLRWAVRATCDTRNSVLYILSNSASVQLLCHKQCWRFFQSVERHPRAVTHTIHAIQANRTIPAQHWGESTIRWWPQVMTQYRKVVNT